jgi:hypothetical protein
VIVIVYSACWLGARMGRCKRVTVLVLKKNTYGARE